METIKEYFNNLTEEQMKYILEILYTIGKEENENIKDKIAEDMDISDEEINTVIKVGQKFQNFYI